MGFVIRYEQLPDRYPIEIGEADDGTHHIANPDFLRHVLNDFRPLIHNSRDSVYYKRIHASWYTMLSNPDPTQGGSVTASAENGEDLTGSFRKLLGEHQKAISTAVDNLEFGYLYNGILQHSDHQFSQRFIDDYVSGDLNYLLWKHVAVLSLIRDLLSPYYRLVNTIAFPKRGGL